MHTTNCENKVKSRLEMNTRLVIFDLDGTLLNTIADLGNGVNHTLEAHDLPTHTLQEFKLMVGRGMRNLVKSALPLTLQSDDAFVDGFLQEFLAFYMEHIDLATLPYPGITEMLRTLDDKGIKLAVASNKIQKGTEKLIARFFPGIPFVAVCGNSPDFPLKPDAALVQYIMSRADANESNTIMVGDSGTDIQTARNAGIPVIAVSWGFRPTTDLTEADSLAGNTQDIIDFLNR